MKPIGEDLVEWPTLPFSHNYVSKKAVCFYEGLSYIWILLNLWNVLWTLKLDTNYQYSEYMAVY